MIVKKVINMDRIYKEMPNRLDFNQEINWDPANPWSSRFSILDNVKLSLIFNETFMGKRAVYGERFSSKPSI